MSPSEIREAIVCNSDWITTGNVAKAQAYVNAASLYPLLPKEQRDEHNELVFDLEMLERQKNQAIQWLNSQVAGGRVRFLGVTNLRNEFGTRT